MPYTNSVAIILTGCLICASVVGGLSGVSQSQSPQRPAVSDAPTPPATVTEADRPIAPKGASPRLHTVTATSADAINRSALQAHGTLGTQAGRHIEIQTTADGVSAVEEFDWVRSVQPALRARPHDIAGAGNRTSLGVASLHDAGITGSDVRVGVIDTGFDTDDPALAANLVEFRQFNQNTQQTHGTQVSTVLTRTAPDSELYLASISTSTDFEAALSYLAEQDVDIVVTAIGFPAFDDDGTHVLSDDIASARANGTLLVASAGNEARRHWQGPFRSTDGDDIHDWAVGANGGVDEQNCLISCQRSVSGRLSLILHWDDDGDGSTYRILLIDPRTGDYIDSSAPLRLGLGERAARLETTVQSRPVDVVIQHTGGPADDTLELTAYGVPTLERRVPASSLSVPSDVEGAVSVGAYQRANESIAGYSSRGPTDDGRQGLTVSGYTDIWVSSGFFGGTSAAAPYTGGVAALVEDASQRDRSPAELQEALVSTTDDIGPNGSDTRTGAGVVNAETAVESVTPSTDGRETDPLVARFGGSDNRIGNLDVLRAVNAANRGEQIDGEPVSNLDVLKVVNHVNRN